MNNQKIVYDKTLLMLFLFLTIAFFYASATLFTPVAPITINKIVGDSSLAGLPGAIFLLIGAITAPIAAKLMQLIGRLNVLRTSLAIGAIGSIACYDASNSDSLYYFILGLMLLGIAGATIVLSRVMITEMYPASKQPKMMGVVFFGAAFGGIIGPVIAHVSSTQSFDRESVSWLIVSSLFVTSFCLSFFPKRDSNFYPHQDSDVNQVKEKDSLHSIDTKRLSIVIAISAVGHALMVSLMSLIGAIMKGQQIEMTLIFLGMGIHFIGMFGMMPLTAKIFARLKYKRTIILSVLVYLFALVLLSMASSHIFYILSLALLGIGWSLCFLPSTITISLISGPEFKFKYMAKNDVISALGGATLSIVGGIVYEYGGQIVLALLMMSTPLLTLILMNMLIRTKEVNA